MSLSQEFESFYCRWLQKADNYSTDNISDYFDKYFTLYVIFNRLYAEATFILDRKNQIKLLRRTSFPDSCAAKSYVIKYLSSSHLIDKLENIKETKDAIENLKKLINEEAFYIKLDLVTGNRQRDKDLELLKELNSRSTNKKAEAILDLLYSIRCNMFHAHKGFSEIQIDLLKPATIILRNAIEILYTKLQQDYL